VAHGAVQEDAAGTPAARLEEYTPEGAFGIKQPLKVSHTFRRSGVAPRADRFAPSARPSGVLSGRISLGPHWGKRWNLETERSGQPDRRL